MSSCFSVRGAVKLCAPAAVLAIGFLLAPAPGAARPDYTRRTKQDCRYCHPPGGWFLNDAGKYFEKNRSLNGYKPPAEPPKQAADQKSAEDQKSKSK
jgi:hypothetical protein